MENPEDLIKESATIIEEIEDKLDTILSNKRKEIEADLEAKIEQNRKNAKDKMEKLEEELSGERDSLKSYRLALSEFDKKKTEIKAEIQAHLVKAAEYQPEIEALAAKTIAELKRVMELNENMEKLNMAALSRVDSMKIELEDKFGTTPASPPASPLVQAPPLTPSPDTEVQELNDVQSSLESELEKLKKIKELLGKDSVVRKELNEIETNSLLEVVEVPTRDGDQDKIDEKQDVEQIDEEVVAEEETKVEKETEELPSQETEETEELPTEDMERTLEKLRKSVEGEKGIKLTYFESHKKMILDEQDIFNAIDKDVEEAQKLYDKLSKTQSPKEQFFTKQEIIWHQETLREFILATIKVCEKEHVSLPQSTADVLNISVLKTILDKVSQENWSNKDYFASFFQYANDLKAAYLDKATPRIEHLKSLIDELAIEE